MRRIVVAITGASGAAYARALVRRLLGAACGVDLIVTPHGRRLLAEEVGVEDLTALTPGVDGDLAVHPYEDLGDSLASGSVPSDGMVICPASINTVGQIAAGLAGNLVTRAAHVHLKQRRRLVIAPRETPLSPIDLRNLLRLSEAGAIIAPACPGFYMGPESISDLVDFFVARLLDLLGVDHDLRMRYGQS